MFFLHISKKSSNFAAAKVFAQNIKSISYEKIYSPFMRDVAADVTCA